MKTTIIYQPADKSIPQLVLEVTYSYWPEVRQTWESPGEPAGVEVESVICAEIDDERENWKDIGGFAYKIIGALAYLCDPKGIEKAVMAAHCEDSQGDPDRERE